MSTASEMAIMMEHSRRQLAAVQAHIRKTVIDPIIQMHLTADVGMEQRVRRSRHGRIRLEVIGGTGRVLRRFTAPGARGLKALRAAAEPRMYKPINFACE